MTRANSITLLGVPFDLGAGRRGARGGPEAIMQAGLPEKLRRLGIQWSDAGLLTWPEPQLNQDALPLTALKYFHDVLAVNEALAAGVSRIVQQGSFPLVLGGDHSIAIGTLAGLASHYSRLGVIWIDAHSDLNTPDTTPSGNIHGMSLAASLGQGDERLTRIGGISPKIRPEHTVLLGVRDLDPGEKASIKAQGITCFTMHDIDRRGMSSVMEEALQVAGKGTDGVHLSFDIDSLDPVEAPGTGTPVKGGLSYREAHLALELLHESGIVTSAELVEVNPSLDTGQKTAQLAVELIGSLLGEQIL
ncbi:arginase [Paenibacillus tianmuensis]|uniref:Arginase n=1 Tax=Paenibacillus tianmuensis TaxID=624147 RepID=A0A1G4PXF3_9BACL|nr:arginase [Paenibacillus tianmuensis]SCW36993.1 arginase [Paenibacillus tianmuensis]